MGAVLRAPLDRSRGALEANPSAYPAHAVALVSDPRGLVVYNRQYWFRLLEVLQSAFPLTARLLGLWSFNGVALRFLEANPPRGWDIDRAPDGLEAFIADELAREGHVDCVALPDRVALREAAQIDAAWRAVFRAPPVQRFQPSPEDAGRLASSHLQRSPAAALVEEHWPLLELRRALLGDPGESKVALPPRLDAPQAWALVRSDRGVAQLPLEPREAELLALLSTRTVEDALATLERACAPDERERLPAQTRAWLARSVQLGFWVGMR